ncbi:hypothetical protein M422DRAFT_267169 [Sphaerobolus stellatus SS14]|uniref:Uncharacterized protein n=1 Tax=Sphaerobolus stellatus (strain SS14) TaxID=990650 RepID=A0A0C9V0T1_SPHS4|nr:hypothetical protein M422DRAFT_267169 [Sphaerobolus stellatus SS14]
MPPIVGKITNHIASANTVEPNEDYRVIAPTLVPPPCVAPNPSSTPPNAHPPSISSQSTLKALLPNPCHCSSQNEDSEDLYHPARHPNGRNLITSAIDTHEQQHSTPQIASI